jgi:hypothetical protein
MQLSETLIDKEKREFALKEIERIESLPRTKRWKAAQQFAIKYNREAAKEHMETLQIVKEAREQNLFNPTASGQKSGLRHGLTFPALVFNFITLFDDKLQGENKGEDGRQMVRKLMKTFPEYQVPRSI